MQARWVVYAVGALFQIAVCRQASADATTSYAPTVAVEVTPVVTLGTVLNGTSVPLDYHEGAWPGLQIGVVTSRGLLVNVDVVWRWPRTSNYSASDDRWSGDRASSYELAAHAGYDARFGRFRLRPGLGIGFARFNYRYRWTSASTPELNEQIRITTRALSLTPSLTGVLDLHPHVFLSASTRVPIHFRVGKGTLESFTRREVGLFFWFGLGGRFG
jgi:hypothetical protein